MRPVVGLLLAEGEIPDPLRLLVHTLAHRVDFRGTDLQGTAALVVPPEHGSLLPSDLPAGLPFALWCSAPAQAGTALADRARVLLHAGALDDVPAPGRPAPTPGAPWPDRVLRVGPDVAGLSSTPVGTAVRARLRRARELPDAPLLVEGAQGWTWQGSPLAPSLLPTALACAAAVLTTDPVALLQALSWGAPVVTSPAAAAQVGARPDLQVVVGADDAARREAVRALAGDDLRAARLGRAGRGLVDQRHQLERTVARLVLMLRLEAVGQEPHGRSDAVLDSLSTPRDAVIRARLGLALAPFHPLPSETLVLPDALSADHTAALPAPASTGAGQPAPVPPVEPAPAPPRWTARRLVKAALRRALGAGAAPLLREVRANRAELARLQQEVSTLRSAAQATTSPAALRAEVELLRAQVEALVRSRPAP